MPNCARCGVDNDATANFCRSCGSPMNTQGYAPPPPPPPRYYRPGVGVYFGF